MQQQPPPPPPAGPADFDSPYTLRTMLRRRYWYLSLNFTSPAASKSQRWEATWKGGSAQAASETALLADVLSKLQDCGSDGHLWESTGEKRDPADNDNIIITQRLGCAFCDERERTITLHHPGPTNAETSQGQQ